LDKLIGSNKRSIEPQINDFLEQKGIPENIYQQFLKDKKPIYNQYDQGSSLSGMLGLDLAGHKVGMNWDKEKNLPYLSISDAWDFEPNAYSKKWAGDKRVFDKNAYIQASLLHKSGNPFKVYDRFYFDPKTKNYIPDSEVARRRSTKVNTNKPLPVDRDVIARRLGLKEKNNK
jgi:hypothetical protein